MHRPARLSSLITAFLLSVALLGCDSSPTSVQDFDVQANMETPSTPLSLVIAQGSTSFEVNYQGLDGHPEAQGSGALAVSKSTESGTPREGSQEWTVTYGENPDGVIQESIYVTGTRGGRQISDTVSVTVSRFIVSTSFANNHAVVTDYENGQRSISSSGGTSASLDSTIVASNSSGVASLEIAGTQAGSATVARRANAPNANLFSFLIYSGNTSFTLTLTFTEETGAGTATYSVDVPVEARGEWVKYGIALDQIGEDFNPVAQRAGGNGPFTSVEMSADTDATYYVDDLNFMDGDRLVANIHDFEQTTFEYSCITLDSSNDVATNSGGFTSRVIDGSGCFGYNYNTLKASLSSDGVVSARVKADEGDELYVFLETKDGNAGGFEYGNGTTVTLPTSGWQTVEIPVSDLGNSVGALQDPGLQNIGFESTQGDQPTFLIDDIRLQESGN